MDQDEVEQNTPPQHILIVEDDRSITEMMYWVLRNKGYDVEVALDGPTGLALARKNLPDLMILDIMLPGVDGLSICRQLREDPATTHIPMIMLTAKDKEQDVIDGLAIGADDYLTKPFNINILLARLNALLRLQQRFASGAGQTARVLRFGDLTLNESSREVMRGQQRIELTATEYSLLRLFMMHPKQVLDRQTILNRVWGYDFMGETNIIEVYVRYLRAKIEEDPSDPKLIATVRGIGYVLKGT